MKLSKILARRLFFPALLALRFDRFLLLSVKKQCCIVNFHGVRKINHGVFNNRHMPALEFEKVLIYLKSNFDIVPLKQLFDLHRNKKNVTKKTIALTFDDGYLNNFEVALPILKKYNIPATFYIITKSLVDDRYLAWPDVIDLLKKHHKKDIYLLGHLFSYPAFYNTQLKLDLPGFLKTRGQLTEKLAYELIDEHKEYLLNAEDAPELLRLVNKQEISKYSNEPLIEFGSHSHSHLNFEYLERNIAVDEFKSSKEILEKTVGKKISSFAFPDGSYTPESVKLGLQAGYDNVVAVEYRHNEGNRDPNILSRFTISNSTTFQSNAIRLARQFDLFGF